MTRPRCYRLVDRQPVPADPVAVDARVPFERLKQTRTRRFVVSTVFLGLDHRFLGEGPPILFETMAFGRDGSTIAQQRCCTWDEAMAQHARCIAWAEQESLKPPPAANA